MRNWKIFVAFALFAGCRSKDEVTPSTVEYAFPDTLLVWDTNTDSMIMKRDITIPDSAITISRMINGLNEKYPEVRLVFLRQSHDTVFTSVPDAEFLGEQMGDAGAAAWYADVVINLTSVSGVNYVSFSMETQSHAASGIIGREKYSNWKRQ